MKKNIVLFNGEKFDVSTKAGQEAYLWAQHEAGVFDQDPEEGVSEEKSGKNRYDINRTKEAAKKRTAATIQASHKKRQASAKNAGGYSQEAKEYVRGKKYVARVTKHEVTEAE